MKFQCNLKLLRCFVLFIIVIGAIWEIQKIIKWFRGICCPLTYIVITGDRYFTTNDKIHQLILQLGVLGTFLTQDVNVIQHQIERLSWIKQVSIRKQWPDTLKIHLVEHTLVARWNDTLGISMTGTIFGIPRCYINKDINHIPILYGPTGKEQDVLSNYLIFNKILRSNRFSIKSVKVDIRDSWQLVLQNDIHLKLGRNNVFERLLFFIKIYPMLIKKINEQNKYIDYIDLRYRSGFAVKWIYSSINPICYDKQNK